MTHSAPGTLHYHPQPSPNGLWLAFGSKRNGVRQLYVMRLEDRREQKLTDLPTGHGAMWAHWQPISATPPTK
jgi:TolB protein